MKTGERIGVIFFLIAVFIIGHQVGKLNYTYEEQGGKYWYDEYETCSIELIDVQGEKDNFVEAFCEANDNINKANEIIDNARWNAWENYETMGRTLDSLENVQNIPEPGSSAFSQKECSFR